VQTVSFAAAGAFGAFIHNSATETAGTGRDGFTTSGTNGTGGFLFTEETIQDAHGSSFE
jgi:hypothetical protein